MPNDGGRRSPLSVVEGGVASDRRVTSYDVAARAGVSQSAVSRCFKPGASVSDRMRERVMAAAAELGYQPNAIARSLITKRSGLVAVIMSDFTNLHYPEVLFELNHGFSSAGVHVLLFTLRRESQVDELLGQVLQYQVDGVIAATMLSPPQVDQFSRRGIPLVFFNRTVADAEVSSVCCDQVAGERLLVNGLVNGGHRAFAIIAGPDDSAVSNQRTAGALERLHELGVEDVPVYAGDYTYESGHAGLLALTESGAGPDALIAANDVMAIGAIDAARSERGLSVPGDLSVVGFDGIAPARWSSYDLTTLRQPVAQMSQAAVDMVLERIDNPGCAPEMRFFTGQLQRGASATLR